MKMIRCLWALLAGIGACLLVSCGRNSVDRDAGAGPSQPPEPDKIFVELRNLALNRSPSDVGLDRSERTPAVWGVVMDRGLANGIATLVALADGSASLYLSSGGGAVGGREHDTLRSAASNLVAQAANHLSAAAETKAFPLPAVGEVCFFLLTTNGVTWTRAPEKDLRAGQHPFSPLYVSAQTVLTQLRSVIEKQTLESAPPLPTPSNPPANAVPKP